MMLADHEAVIGQFLIMLLIVTVPACVALVQGQRGRYNLFLVGCAIVPIIFAVYLIIGSIFSLVQRGLTDHESIEVEPIIFCILLALPFLWAGWSNLSRLKHNKRKTQ